MIRLVTVRLAPAVFRNRSESNGTVDGAAEKNDIGVPVPLAMARRPSSVASRACVSTLEIHAGLRPAIVAISPWVRPNISRRVRRRSAGEAPGTVTMTRFLLRKFKFQLIVVRLEVQFMQLRCGLWQQEV